MFPTAQCVNAAGSEAFVAASRMLFGPVTQSFPKGMAPSIPTLVSLPLGTCRLSRINANPHFVFSDRAFRRSFDPDAIKVLLQIGGSSRFEQQSLAVDLGPRAAVVYDPLRSYSLQNFSEVDQLILQVPRSTFSDGTLARLAQPVRVAADAGSLTRIVSGLMQMAIVEAEHLDSDGRRRVGESLIQLVDGLIRGKPLAPEFRVSPLEALRERIIAHIDANLHHSGLSAEVIAHHMGCSRRYLHRAFEREDMTLERFIWDRRLERSRGLLSKKSARVSISEIAFACGFNSSAHFSRVFRNKYGMTPREMRERIGVPLH